MRPTTKNTARDKGQPRISFLDLPREIRDLVYGYRFNTSLTVVIWCAMQPGHPQRPWCARGALQKTEQGKIVVSNVRDQLRILRCNSVVAREAARIFYGKNKFSFGRGWTWDIVVDWLETIGLENRGFLSRLELDMPSNSLGWQMSPDYPSAFGRGRYYTRAAPGRKSRRLGLVPVNASVPPVFDRLFKLLSSSDLPHGSKGLSLDMLLEGGLLPECQLGRNDRHPRREHFNMDIPDSLERHRALWADKMGHRLEILWHGFVREPAFSEHRLDIETKWVILSVVEENRVQTWHPEMPSLSFSQFVLRRRDITDESIGGPSTLHEST